MTTLVVTSTADSGDGTLRAALAAAQDGDVITFDPTVFGPGKSTTISLSSTLEVTSSVQIIGPVDTPEQVSHDDYVTLVGNDTFTLMSIDAGKTVLLHDLDFEHGSGSGTTGSVGGDAHQDQYGVDFVPAGTGGTGGTAAGAILNAGHLTISSSTFYNDQATGGQGGAGGNSDTGTHNGAGGGAGGQAAGGILNVGSGTLILARENGNPDSYFNADTGTGGRGGQGGAYLGNDAPSAGGGAGGQGGISSSEASINYTHGQSGQGGATGYSSAGTQYQTPIAGGSGGGSDGAGQTSQSSYSGGGGSGGGGGGGGTGYGIYNSASGEEIVTNTADYGYGSLRQAIFDAAAGETIVLDKGLTGTIHLSTALNITKNVNLQLGSDIFGDATSITIDGSATTTDINVGAGVTATIAGLHLVSGDNQDTNGTTAAIVNAGAVTLTDSDLATRLNAVSDQSGATLLASQVVATGQLGGAPSFTGSGYSGALTFAFSGTETGSAIGDVSGAVVSVVVTGPGTEKLEPGFLVPSAVNTYTGGTTIQSGTLELARPGDAANGPIAFSTSAVGTLQIDGLTSGTFGSTITAIGQEDRIDLSSFAYVAGQTFATVSADRTALTLSNGTDSVVLNFGAGVLPDADLRASDDGSAHTLLTFQPTSAATVAVATIAGDGIIDGGEHSGFVTVTGTSTLNSDRAVTVHVDGSTAAAGHATTDVDGTWSASIDARLLSDGSHTVQAVAEGGSTSPDATVVVDTHGPTATLAVDTTLTNHTDLTYTATFSEAVTGVTASSFTPVASGLSGTHVASVTPVAASASGAGYSTYTVDVATGTGEGSVQLGLNAAGITDLAGNDMAGATFGGQPITTPAMIDPATDSGRYGGGTSGQSFYGLADFNGDGKLDLATIGTDQKLRVFTGDGSGGFGATATWTSSTLANSHSILAIGDLNGDGKADIFVAPGLQAGANDTGEYTFLGNGDGTFAASVDPSTNPYDDRAGSAAIADVTGDGRPDVVLGNNYYVAVLPGNGEGSVGATVLHYASDPSNDQWDAVAVGDLNADGDVDAVVGGGYSNLGVVTNGSAAATSPFSSYFEGEPIRSVALADVNEDGKLDLIGMTSNSGESTAVVALGDGNGSFAYGSANRIVVQSYLDGTLPALGGSHAIAQGDINGDGHVDFVVSLNNQVEVFYGNGTGNFSGQVYSLPVGTIGQVQLADVNGDGRLDIVGNGPDGSLSVLLNGGPAPTNSTATTIDRTAPAVSAPSLAAGSDSGSSTTDDVTSVAAPTLQGTAEANSTVVLSYTGQDGIAHSLAPLTATGGSWSVTLPSSLSDGSYGFTATATDAAGNATTSSALPVTIDTTAPARPAAPADASLSNGKLVYANDTDAQALTGTAEKGALVTVYDGSSTTPVGTTAADASTGQWSLTIGRLAGGSSHSFAVTETDAAGNVSAKGAALAFTVDPGVVAVTNSLDDGSAGSLRSVLANAHAGDTIAFAPDVTAITLSQTLTIDKNVTISGLRDGSTAPGVTIDGSGGTHDFADITIDAGVTAAIEGLVIQNGHGVGAAATYSGSGYVPAAGGTVAGGVFDLGDLTLSNTVLTDNSASGGAGYTPSTDGLGGGSGGSAAGGVYVDAGASLHLGSGVTAIADAATGGSGGRGGDDFENHSVSGGSGASATDVAFAAATAGQDGREYGQGHGAGGAPGQAGGYTGSGFYYDGGGGGGGGGLAYAEIGGPGTVTGVFTPVGLADASVSNGVVNAARDTAGQAITGTARAGSTVALDDNGVAFGAPVVADANGRFSIAVGPLVDGTDSFTVTSTAEGSTSPFSTPLGVSVDTSADLGGDLAVTTSPVVNNAGKTAVAYAVAGLDGDATATVTFADGQGHSMTGVNGTADLSGLVDGPVSVAVSATDTADNTAQGTGASLTLDTTADVAGDLAVTTSPVVNNAGKAAVAYTLAGLDPDATATVTFTDGHGHTATSVSGVAELSAFVDGSVSVAVSATDTAGNTAPGAGTSLTLDTAASLAIAPVTGDDAVDPAEYLAGVTISGSTTGVEAGQPVSVDVVDVNGVHDAATGAVVGQDGSWHTTLPTGLTDGTYTVEASVSDLAGNVAQATDGNLVITLDHTPPAVGTPMLAWANAVAVAGDDPGRLAVTGTPETSPVIIGTAELGSHVVLTYTGDDGVAHAVDGGTVTQEVIAGQVNGQEYYLSTTDDEGQNSSGLGAWAITIPAALTEGQSYHVTVTATDPSGNNATAAPLDFVVDGTAPTNTASTPLLAPGYGTNTSATAGVAHATHVVLTGTALPDQGVFLADYVGGGAGGAGYSQAYGVADSTGVYAIPIDLAGSNNEIEAYVYDEADNFSESTSSSQITLDTTPPTLTFPSPGTNVLSSSDYVFAGQLSEKLSGTLDASHFSLTTTGSITGDSIASVTVAPSRSNYPDGPESVLVDVLIGSGTGTVTLNFTGNGLTDVAGNSFDPTSESLGTINVDTRPAEKPSAPMLAPASDTGISSSDGITDAQSLTLTGTTVSGYMLGLYDNGSYSAHLAQGDAQGHYTFVDVHLSPGQHQLLVAAYAPNGTSSESDEVGVVIDDTSPTVTLSRDGANPADPADLRFLATFSEAVAGVAASDFQVTATGSAAGTVSSVVPVGTDGTTYEVHVAKSGGDGTIGLDFPGGTGTDVAGNALPTGIVGPMGADTATVLGGRSVSATTRAAGVLGQDGDQLTVSSVGGSADNVGQSLTGTYGSLTLSADGTYTYAAGNAAAIAAAPAGVLTDSFAYTASDGRGDATLSSLSVSIVGPRVTAAELQSYSSLIDASDGYQIQVVDTSANVVGGLATLQAEASHILSVTAQSGTVTVGVGKFLPDESVLDKVSGGFAINGQAAAIQSNLDAVAADASHINSITAQNGTVAVSVATFEADKTVLDEVAGGFAISDTAANIVDGLASLQADAGHILSVAAQSGTVTVGLGKFLPDESVLDKVSGGFAVNGQAAAIQTNLDALAADATHITSITAQSGTVTVGIGKFLPDRTVLDKVSGGFAVNGQAAAIGSNLDALAADASHINSITAQNGTVTTSVATFEADTAVLDKIAGGFAISDAAAIIASFPALAALSAEIGRIDAITGVDARVTAGWGKFSQDQSVLDTVVGGFDIKGQSAAISAHADALNADASHIDAVSFADANPVLRLTQAQTSADANLVAAVTGPYVLQVANPDGTTNLTGHGDGLTLAAALRGHNTLTGGGDDETFSFAPNFGQTNTITDFYAHLAGAGHDTIALPSSEFADFAAVLQNTMSTPSGTLVTAPGTGDSVFLPQVAASALQGASADFRFT